ncbi:short-chain dehydrogenase reductase 3b-like [Cucurbita maxima]|uniref:Short-chain dehydrogenase reductase 3b-like n=1 Tax=Cucurbita maxima TaxID=3661 RepID=A0A6J1JWU4_CUCMA|nr:short-chain dehydrogenase reductase 3b-like [Cucurbita maxima]
MSKPRLQGKVALITGAASGIGEETARLFAANGAIVVIADIQDELGQKLAAEIGQNQASFHHCDVRDEVSVEKTVAFTVEKHGRLDILFSNAGKMGPLAGILDLDMEEFENTMRTNVKGVTVTVKHAARAMVKSKTRGSIICTSSVAAAIGGVGPAAYTVSKSAVVGVVKTACSELGKYGIRVNGVSPYGVATPMTCESYNISVEEAERNTSSLANLKGIVLKCRHVAEAVLFLASDESAYVSGHNLTVDGGFTMVCSSIPPPDSSI